MPSYYCLLLFFGALNVLLILGDRVSTKEASDLGVCISSSAAAKLLTRFVQNELRQPHLVQMQLQSGVEPWFDSIAHVDARNRIAFGQLKLHFLNNYIEAELTNVTLRSASNIYLLPLPFFLGKDTAHITVQLSRGALKLRTIENFEVALEDCSVSISDIDIQLDNAYLLNHVLSPIHRYLLPKSIIRDSVCGMVESSVMKLRRRFALEMPLTSIVPPKFTPYLLESNVSLFLQLESIQTNNEELTVSVSIDWTEMATVSTEGLSTDDETKIKHSKQLFDFEDNTATNILPLTAQPFTNNESTTPDGDSGEVKERLQIWVKDTLINELIERFHWDFEWMEEQIPVESPKLPQSTSAFLSTLCTNCYFLLRVTANGPPHVESINSTLVLKKSDKIFMKVVNPTRNVDAVFVNFALTLSVQLTPQIENGIFRTQVDLLDTDIRMQEGAFPPGWTTFVQDLVKGMIMDVIWPNIKQDIETLSYSDGVQIPIYCGLEPNTAHLHFDEGRFGASAALHLDDASLSQCVQQLKSKLPDPSKLLVIREKKETAVDGRK